MPDAFTVALPHAAFAGALHTSSSAAWQSVGTGPVGPFAGLHAPPLLVLKQNEKQSNVFVAAPTLLHVDASGAVEFVGVAAAAVPAVTAVALKGALGEALARHENDDHVVLPHQYGVALPNGRLSSPPNPSIPASS